VNGGGYEIEDCQRMIDRCNANIATLQEGIDREQASIDHFEKIKAALQAEHDVVISNKMEAARVSVEAALDGVPD
jgi:hypothetical protein